MRRTKEWEQTKQSILSAKELVGILCIILCFFLGGGSADGILLPDRFRKKDLWILPLIFTLTS